MTYLAVQMSLYLASAALIGICLGWLFWGRRYHRRAAELHSEMTASLEEERNRSDDMRRDLEGAEDKLKAALESERAKSAKAITSVQELLDREKEDARAARAEIEQLRSEMETAIGAEKASASTAIQEAMEEAKNLKSEVGDAKSRETQIRAELEELRLMAGAEKLAAQSARAEADQLRRDMQVSLDAERETSQAARQALDDIRGTLARTFGEGAGVIAAFDAQAAEAEKPPRQSVLALDDSEKKTQSKEESRGDIAVDDTQGKEESDVFSTLSGIDIEPGTAFDVPEEKSIPTEVIEKTGDKAVSIDSASEVDADRLTPSDPSPLAGADQESSHSDNGMTNEPDQAGTSISAIAQPTDHDGGSKPSSFFDQRPVEIDSLQEIGGIDSDIERLLNEAGCYQFKQLAHFSTEDIDWLSQTVPSLPDLKDRIERDGWIEQARELQIKKYMATNADRPRWWSRRRLQ